MLAVQLRRAVLDYLVENEAITETYAGKLGSLEHTGFAVDNKARVGANDPEGRRYLPTIYSATGAP